MSLNVCKEISSHTEVGMSDISHNDIDSLVLKAAPKLLEKAFEYVKVPGGTGR